MTETKSRYKIVIQYANWCRPCQLFTPQWLSVLPSSSKQVIVAAVESKHVSLFSNDTIPGWPEMTGFPTTVVLNGQSNHVLCAHHQCQIAGYRTATAWTSALETFAPGITSDFSLSRMGGGGGATVVFDVYYRKKDDRILTTVMKPLLDDLKQHYPIRVRWISKPQLLVSPQLVIRLKSLARSPIVLSGLSAVRYVYDYRVLLKRHGKQSKKTKTNKPSSWLFLSSPTSTKKIQM